MPHSHRLPAVRGELLARAGENAAAVEALDLAIERCGNEVERDHLVRRRDESRRVESREHAWARPARRVLYRRRAVTGRRSSPMAPTASSGHHQCTPSAPTMPFPAMNPSPPHASTVTSTGSHSGGGR